MLKCSSDITISPVLSNEMIVGLYGNSELSGLVFKEITNTNLWAIRTSPSTIKKASNLIKQSFGFDFPEIGKQVSTDDVSLSWISKNHYLLRSPRDKLNTEKLHNFKSSLTEKLVILDQSHAFCMLEITGSKILDLMQKIISLDLRESSFQVGQSVSTIMVHSKIIIQRTKSDTYTLLLPRTHAFGIWQWISSASKEFGYEVTR